MGSVAGPSVTRLGSEWADDPRLSAKGPLSQVKERGGEGIRDGKGGKGRGKRRRREGPQVKKNDPHH